MRIFNADGSEADMCGNALLCAARYLVETDKGKAKATIHTLAGPREVSILPGGLIRAGMGRPEWDPGQIPVLSDKSLVLKEPIMLGGCLLEVSCVSLGNPHCIVHVPDLGMVDWPGLDLGWNDIRFSPKRLTWSSSRSSPGIGWRWSFGSGA